MQGHRRSALTSQGYRGCIRAAAAGRSRTTPLLSKNLTPLAPVFPDISDLGPDFPRSMVPA